MALYLKKELENGAELAVWQITETEDELKTLSSVPTDEMEEINLYGNESQRKQRLAVRALINELFDDENGNLRADASGDSTHVYAKYDLDWCDWLCTKAIVR